MISHDRLRALESSLMGLHVALNSVKNMIAKHQSADFSRFQAVAIATRDEINKVLNAINDLNDIN